MKKSAMRGLLLVTVAWMALGPGAAPAQEYDWRGSGMQSARSRADRFYLGFSLGDGAYFNYKCDIVGGCRTVIAAPLDFEVIGGFRLAGGLYLDVAVNWAIDYYKYYYDKITYVFGVRPGVRYFFPGLFRRFFYLRAAVPIGYTIDEANNVLVGLLFGLGIEWRFAQVGVFAEADIMPYFLEIYPGYYVIPTQARIGISARF